VVSNGWFCPTQIKTEVQFFSPKYHFGRLQLKSAHNFNSHRLHVGDSLGYPIPFQETQGCSTSLKKTIEKMSKIQG